MLPFNKRSQAQSSQALPRYPLSSQSMIYRPQLESFSDDERTRVMTRSSTPPPLPSQRRATPPPPPPTAKQKAAAAQKAIRCYPPKPSMDEPTMTAFDAPPPSRRAAVHIPAPPPVPADMAVTNVVVAPSSQQMVPPSPTSTSDLPPAVITGTMKITSRPTPSWAAALVALGVFAGLVTAVLARGDGDAILHAGAQLVDPTHQAGAAAAVVAPIVQPTAVIATPVATPTPMTPVAVKASCAEDKDQPQPKVDAKSEPKVEAKIDAPAPVVVKSAPQPVVKTVAAPPPPVVAKTQPVVQTKVAAAPPPKTDTVVAKPAAKAAKSAPADDASAADALAKAQLEAALGR